MFDSPNWMGSFITSRTNKDINDLNRKHEVIMEDIKHKHEMLLQDSRNRVTEEVAEANRASTEEIARLNREHEATIAKERNKNAISVALIQAASKATNTALPYVFPAIMAGRLAGKNSSNNNEGKGNKPNSTTPVVNITKSETEAETQRKKADDLFPELEPTFGVSFMNGDELNKITNKLPTINITQLVPAIGAVLSVAGPLMAIL